jgi:hypothetical protein
VVTFAVVVQVMPLPALGELKESSAGWSATLVERAVVIFAAVAMVMPLPALGELKEPSAGWFATFVEQAVASFAAVVLVLLLPVLGELKESSAGWSVNPGEGALVLFAAVAAGLPFPAHEGLSGWFAVSLERVPASAAVEQVNDPFPAVAVSSVSRQGSARPVAARPVEVLPWWWPVDVAVVSRLAWLLSWSFSAWTV